MSGTITDQIDPMFVTDSLASGLTACDTGSLERVFATPLLSDHLPVVATFTIWQSREELK